MYVTQGKLRHREIENLHLDLPCLKGWVWTRLCLVAQQSSCFPESKLEVTRSVVASEFSSFPFFSL